MGGTCVTVYIRGFCLETSKRKGRNDGLVNILENSLVGLGRSSVRHTRLSFVIETSDSPDVRSSKIYRETMEETRESKE